MVNEDFEDHDDDGQDVDIDNATQEQGDVENYPSICVKHLVL